MSQPYLVSVGRALLSSLFVLSGLSKMMDWGGRRSSWQRKVCPWFRCCLAPRSSLKSPAAFRCCSAGMPVGERGCCSSNLIPTTLLFHNFWAFTGAEQQIQLVNFLKNLSIMDGLSLVAASDRAAPVAVREIDRAEKVEAQQRRRAVG